MKKKSVSQNVNSYIQHRKSWTIKNVLTNYFKAVNLNSDIYREAKSGRDVPFEKVRQLSEILYTCKEELYLIYKRLRDPRKNEYESADKYLPNDIEMDFIHNVGLLFHKAMVVRELKYMLEYYETDADEDYFELKRSHDEYINRLLILFEKGITRVQPFLVNFRDDVIVMSYFLENSRYVKSIIGLDVVSLFKKVDSSFSLDEIYIKVANYFIESGWTDRAKKILFDAINTNPENSAARDLLVKHG